MSDIIIAAMGVSELTAIIALLIGFQQIVQRQIESFQQSNQTAVKDTQSYILKIAKILKDILKKIADLPCNAKNH
jgi:uncharacterized protein with von Willebrand factor type A (vWA) domain